MAGKVVHLPDETHARAKERAEGLGLTLRQYVERLIEEGISNPIRLLNGGGATTTKPRPGLSVVPKKSIPIEPYTGNHDEIYERPPFWEGRG